MSTNYPCSIRCSLRARSCPFSRQAETMTSRSSCDGNGSPSKLSIFRPKEVSANDAQSHRLLQRRRKSNGAPAWDAARLLVGQIHSNSKLVHFFVYLFFFFFPHPPLFLSSSGILFLYILTPSTLSHTHTSTYFVYVRVCSSHVPQVHSDVKTFHTTLSVLHMRERNHRHAVADAVYISR